MTCIHHFLLPASNGEPYALGVCKLCGLERRFLNFWPYDDEEGEDGRAMRQELSIYPDSGHRERRRVHRPSPVWPDRERAGRFHLGWN